MKNAFIIFAVLTMAQILACCQEPPRAQSALLTLEDGVIANGSYSNDCAGISFPISKGWEITTQFARNLPQVKAKTVATDRHLLLSITRDTGSQIADRMALTAIDASRTTLNARDFISQYARKEIFLNRQNDKLIRDAFPFELGGRDYFRSDYVLTLPVGELYRSFVATSFRNYFFVWTVITSSPKNLDQSIGSLQSIVFREDRRSPLCDGAQAEKIAP